MQDINWNMFNLKNPDKRMAFQNMCKHLFCRELSISGYDLQANYNNAGLEAKPVLHDGKYYGFQCKYVELATNPNNFYRQIKKSLDIAYRIYKSQLDVIYIYSNADIQPDISDNEASTQKSDTNRLKIQEDARKNGITIEWNTKDSLELILNEPKNDDIATFYFSESRELNFLDSSISIEDKTFLNSEEFIPLPIREHTGYDDVICLLQKRCCAIVLGDAGTGKTLMMKKFFSHFKDDFLKNYSNAITGATIFPVFIRLRECINGNLEDILRQRLRDYRIDKTANTFKYLYFLDGLDEVSANFIDNILNYVETVKDYENTHGIVFSSRKDSFNLVFMYRHFPDIKKIGLLPLTIKYIEDYFRAKKDENKIKKLQELTGKNRSLVADLNDIFSINLFWNMIERVDEATTKIDLCEQSVNYFLNKYNKLNEISLPEPKTQYIKELFSDIAYHMRTSNLLNIKLHKLQLLIQGRFDRLTYDDTNKIIYCFSELFFEKADHQDQMIFSFRHRRFQEYFLCKKVLEVFPKHPCVLRELQLLNDKDFILMLFLKYGIKESIANRNILLNLALRFFEAYLGSDYWAGYKDSYIGIRSDYGVGGVNPFEQDEFINALASQTIENIFILFESLGIKKANLSNPKIFSKLIVLFHKKNNINVFDNMRKHFSYKEEELEKIKFNSIYDMLYFNKFFCEKDISLKVYDERIKKFKINPNTDFMSIADEGCQHVLSFFNYLIDYNIPFLCTIIKEIEIEHLELLCYQLLRNEYIHLIVSEETEVTNLKSSIVARIENNDKDTFLLNTIVFYNLVTHKDYGIETLKTRFEKVNQNNLPTWERNIEANQYIAILLKKNKTIYTPNYKFGIEIKNISISDNSLDSILQKIISVVKNYNFSTYNWFKYKNSNLIGAILATYPFVLDDIKKVLHLLFKYDSVVSMLTIFYSIFNINLNLFKQVANEAILNKIYEESTKQLSYYDDNSNAEHMFSAMYAYFNTGKSHQLLLKGLNNSICRPAFRGEDLIDHVLPYCLSLFAVDNWYSEYQLEIFASRIYDMLKIMSDTTDGGTDLSLFKEVLLEYIPSSSLLNEDEIYNTKTKNMDKETENSKGAVAGLQKNNLTMENIDHYYKCRIDGADYNSTETWESLINFELENDKDLNNLFSVLIDNRYPEPYGGKVNEVFPLITAVLLKNPKTKQRIIDFIISQGGRSGLVNMIKASMYNSDIASGKRYFEELLLLCEMIVYPMNASSLKAEKRVDLVSDIISKIENSTKEDWYINENDERILRLDPNIKIISSDFDERRQFHEEWAIRYSDSHAYLYQYYLYYNSSLIKKYKLVSVDGGRATLPIPRAGTNIVSRKDYRFALIINESRILEYVYRYGLIVE
ncbi:hypothetical protein DFR58_12929 [Anaerobacterium chartisolvens]|uniref:NACHT domain-containing protein n=1 Tax=Anaerobacterium chartisolvens TaxID=1297424 RepID=A0A369AQE4_9FIRM|nr:hypothetical protein [Anaerobacterium chartisolvens]RCX10437.1 hypothetical protein DFR58_12929 [Anaerobacterium chartisolvens]